jgi:hypothetical protein
MFDSTNRQRRINIHEEEIRLDAMDVIRIASAELPLRVEAPQCPVEMRELAAARRRFLWLLTVAAPVVEPVATAAMAPELLH